MLPVLSLGRIQKCTEYTYKYRDIAENDKIIKYFVRTYVDKSFCNVLFRSLMTFVSPFLSLKITWELFPSSPDNKSKAEYDLSTSGQINGYTNATIIFWRKKKWYCFLLLNQFIINVFVWAPPTSCKNCGLSPGRIAECQIQNSTQLLNYIDASVIYYYYIQNDAHSFYYLN